MSVIKTVGIIGFGGFGKLAARLLPESISVIVYDTRPDQLADDSVAASLEQVAHTDVVLLTIPLTAYDTLLPELAKHLQPKTLIIDVCSVKLIPERLIKKHLPNHTNLLITHPLFGPQSVNRDATGRTLVVTKATGERAQHVLKYCEQDLGLKIKRMTADEHDRAMAQVHGLTFFLAKGLDNLQLKETPITTPFYEIITELIEFDTFHTEELFETIELGNPYAAKMRADVINELVRIDKHLESKKGFEA